MHRWRLAPEPPSALAARLPDVHPVALSLLAARGITDPEEIRRFLSPDFARDLHDPFLFRQMEEACARVWKALTTGEQIVIHGDYDADGISGSAVLMTTLRQLADQLGASRANLSAYLPHREKEGYGIRVATVEKLAAEGKTLMITVDCGISCRPEISRATELGMDTIVVDHHQIPEQIPECIILHPLVEGETYPFKKLAAVGVAFKFACGLMQYAARQGKPFPAGFDKWQMDLVSIATVTDFVPLVGENRALEKYGLLVLNKTRRTGLRALIEVAGLEYGTMDTVSVGFSIGPRINAASRMEHARIAFDCLMAETEEEARALADQLNQVNRDRQKYTEKVMGEARVLLAEQMDRKVHILRGEGWLAGIVGLVAGKIMNERGRPVFVFGAEEGRMVGSGRSIEGFNVVTAMECAKEHIARFGGHPQACGLTIEGDGNFDRFVEIVTEHAEEMLAEADLRPLVEIDAELKASQITWELVAALASLEPFGEGNPRPKFLLRGLELGAVDVIGKNKNTVRMTARGDMPKELKLIGFNFVARAEGFGPGMRMDAVVELGINEWNGRREIQLRLVDIAEAGTVQLERKAASVQEEHVRIPA